MLLLLSQVFSFDGIRKTIAKDFVCLFCFFFFWGGVVRLMDGIRYLILIYGNKRSAYTCYSISMIAHLFTGM